MLIHKIKPFFDYINNRKFENTPLSYKLPNLYTRDITHMTGICHQGGGTYQNPGPGVGWWSGFFEKKFGFSSWYRYQILGWVSKI